MNNQIGSCWQIIFEPQTIEDDVLSAFLEETFGVLSIDYDNSGGIIYTAYTQTEPDFKQITDTAKLWNLTLPDHTIEFIRATNWLTKNVIKFAPIETKDFLIYGSHEETTPQTGKIPISIYAATAFGSGQHQTTKSCLELISLLNHQNVSPQNILDMGTGSGILALATLKLWPKATALAADIDTEAVVVALQNASANNLSERITAIQSTGYQNPQIGQCAPYDLILANILARPLIEMAPELSQNLKTGGYAILSGFIAEQTDWVVDAHRQTGLSLVKIYKDENWRAALLEKTK